jgi:hypothetical protein
MPAPATTWGYTNLVLYDNFTSTTIDLNNTLAPGFNWYVNNAWPFMNAGNSAWLPMNTSTATPSSDLIVSGQQVDMTTDVSHLNESLNTCGSLGSQSYVGKAFGGGFYLEVRMSANPALATSAAASWAGWPIFWGVPVEFLDGAFAYGTPFVEADGFEQFPTGTGTITKEMALHEWHVGASSSFQFSASNYDVSAAINGADLSQPHRFGFLWVPQSLNSGTGLLQRFFDGVHITASDVTYSATAHPTPDTTLPIGTFAEMDSEHFCILLGAGPSWPTFIQSVQLWQHP